MLIALARKLAISLWRYVETGLVPDGAVMAKTTPHMAAATPRSSALCIQDCGKPSWSCRI
jgi:hypothetical protein